MKNKIYMTVSNSDEETFQIGSHIAYAFKNRVIAVNGDLGAGKTHLAKGIAKALGITRHVTSPTFNIMNIYKYSEGSEKDLVFYHLDAYRLLDEEDAYNIGIEEVLVPKGISLIEWADNIAQVLPKDVVDIRIEKGTQENQRIFYISADKESIDRMAVRIYEDIT